MPAAPTPVGEQLERWRRRGWELLHDLPWPGRARATLDHVAVGPGGVLVVAAQDWSAVSTAGGRLRSEGRSRTAECRAVAAGAADVAALLAPRHRTAARGVLVLPRHPLAAMVVEAGTVVVGLPDLDAWRVGLPRRLDADGVAAAATRLRGIRDASGSPAQLTLEAFLAASG